MPLILFSILAYLITGGLIGWLISPLAPRDWLLVVGLWPFILISRYDGTSEDHDDWSPPSGMT